MGRCSNNTGHKAKISKLRRDSTHLFDFFLDEAGASFTRVMMEAESGLEGILKGQTPSNSKGKSLLKKPNGKLYCPEGDDTFQIRVWPTRDSPKEQCLRLLFRWSDLYYMGYHCNESWYILEDEWEITLPSQSQVKHRKNGIQFLPIEASYLGLNKYVTIGVFDLMKFYKTLMHSPAILDGDGDVLRYFDACQMALPAVVFSEALRNAIFRRWVFNELATTVGSTTPGTKVPRDFGIDFNHWADDSTKLFIENPAPHPKLISRLAIIKRRIFNKLPLLEPQYCSARAVAKVGKIHINIVVLGHIYSGKSTTAGHLIHKLGGIGKEAFENLEEEAAAMDRRSFKYAWIFDKLRAERERGITIDISLHKFETDKYCFSIIDAPGHQAFIKNMITGISQADCALLILDSTDGFEAGISKDGQTSEHIALSYALGVKQMICCCNKMDATTPKYSQARYQEVMNKTRPVLKKFHYNPDLIPFVPISGFEGENLVEGSLNLDWYKGPTLLQALDRINEPRWPWRLPLRLPLQDVYRIGGIGTISAGCIKTGVLTPSMEVSFTPTGLTSKVLSVEMHHEPISMALPGDRVGFIVEEALGNDLKRGHVASDAKDPAKEASSFTGRIIVLEHDDFQIRNGSVLFLHCHTAHTCVKISEILTKVDRKSGKLEDRFPRFLSGGQSGSVNMTATKPMVVEIFKKYPHLGCFALRNRQRVVAVGVIESVDG